MKLRIAALAAVVALAAITLLAGCSKTTSNANSTNTVANSNAGVSKSPGLMDAQPSPSATSTTGTSSGSSTPTDVFEAYYEAIKAKDVNAVRQLFSKSMVTMMEDQAKRSNKTVDEVMAEGLKQASAEVPETMPETRNEKIEGDTATLEIRDEKKDKWETIHFVKEAGAWKLSLDK
jgi:predicted lipid-binding transport protein (Tim44 family)